VNALSPAVIQKRGTNNVPTVSYTRGTDLSGSLEGAGGIGGLLARSSSYSGGNWTSNAYYHADGNGNITYLVNSNQTSGAIYRYDPYGNLISKSGTLADANVYRFSSKELHVNSGLYYYLYRFYSPNWQRWINRDPITEKGDINLYRFVENRPLNAVDPIGEQFAPDRPGVQPIPMPGPIFPRDPYSSDKNQAQVPETSGNAPVAYPGIPTVRLPTCQNQGEQRITKPPAPTGETCPCSNLPIRCFGYEVCELIPISQGLNRTIMGLRWVPYTRCTKCPEY
jgi:RHS repeat-associated protein